MILSALALCLMFTFVTCGTSARIENISRRLVIAYSRCSSEEASSDILTSVDEIEASLTKKHISLKIDVKEKTCGYLLINGADTKKISGALTDVELLQSINDFFK